MHGNTAGTLSGPTGVVNFCGDHAVRGLAELSNTITRWSQYNRECISPPLQAPDLLVNDVQEFFRTLPPARHRIPTGDVTVTGTVRSAKLASRSRPFLLRHAIHGGHQRKRCRHHASRAYHERMLINAVPQWQGAVNERASGIPEGCLALAGLAARILDLRVNHVYQDRQTSPLEGGLANRSALTGPNRAAQQEAVAGSSGPILTIGGDCGVELEPLRAGRRRYGAGLAVAWFDAHPDLNTPQSSPSGAFHGMVLRALLGEGDPEFTASPALEHGRVALVGTRAVDPSEHAAIDRGLATQTDDAAMSLRDASHLYVHVDLDVLDPTEFEGLNYPEPGGLSIAELVVALDSLGGFNVVGAGITECVGSPDQIEVLAPVIATIGNLLNPATSPT